MSALKEALDDFAEQSTDQYTSFMKSRNSPAMSSVSKSPRFTTSALSPTPTMHSNSSQLSSPSTGIITKKNASSRLMNETTSSTMHKKDAIMKASYEKKVDFLLNNITIIDKRVKKLSNYELLQDKVSSLETEIRTFRAAEGRRKSAMQDEIESLKKQLSILLRKDELIAQRDLGFPVGESQIHVDAKAIANNVYTRVKEDINKKMDEVLDICIKEQTSFLSKWSDNRLRMTEDRIEANEEKISKLSNANRKVKEIVQDARTDIELYKDEMLSTIEMETKGIIEKVGRKVNDTIIGSTKVASQLNENATQSLQNSRFESIREDFIKGLKTQASETSKVLETLNRDLLSLRDEQALQELQMSKIATQAGEALATAQSTITQSSAHLHTTSPSSSSSSKGVSSLAGIGGSIGLSAAEQKREMNFVAKQESMRLDAAMSTLQRNLVSLQSDVEAAHINLSRHDDRLAHVVDAIEGIGAETRTRLANLEGGETKFASHIESLVEKVEGVAHTRQAVELVLREIDSRSRDDSSWAYNFKRAARSLDSRIAALEVATGNISGAGVTPLTGATTGGTSPTGQQPGPMQLNTTSPSSSYNRDDSILRAPGPLRRIALLESRVSELTASITDSVNTSEEVQLFQQKQSIQNQHIEDLAIKVVNIEKRCRDIWELGEFEQLHVEVATESAFSLLESTIESVNISPNVVSFEDSNRCKVIINNTSTRMIAYKVKVNVKGVFIVKGIDNYLLPNSSCESIITLRPQAIEKFTNELKNAILAIEIAIPHNHNNNDANDMSNLPSIKEFWASSPISLRKSLPTVFDFSILKTVSEADAHADNDGHYSSDGDDDDDEDEDEGSGGFVDPILMSRIADVDGKRLRHREKFMQNL